MAALSCAGLLAAAVFVPAPVAVLPLLVSVGIGVPMFATWELSRRVRGLAGNDDRPSVVAGDDDWPDAVAGDDAPDAGAAVSGASAARAIADLRRALARLPETRHPLDF
ncbi:MAG TPA: hypothetical protein VN213_10365 [Solirubrobacteraceae bacterium]|nr:hypothetical protein [Solirubrobacteraceae bacterium]